MRNLAKLLIYAILIYFCAWAASASASASESEFAAHRKNPLTPTAVGFHVAAWHSNPSVCAGLEKCNNSTPGVFIQTADDFLMGYYKNSLLKPTFYAGRIIYHAQRRALSFDLAAVAATGYPAAKIVPLLTPTLGLALGKTRLQVGYLPRLGKVNETHVLHFEIVREL